MSSCKKPSEYFTNYGAIIFNETLFIGKYYEYNKITFRYLQTYFLVYLFNINFLSDGTTFYNLCWFCMKYFVLAELLILQKPIKLLQNLNSNRS